MAECGGGVEALKGSWDYVDGENFDAYMKEIGVGMIMRMTAKGVKPRLIISENNGTWTLRTESSIKTLSSDFVPGVEFDETTADGRHVKSTINFVGNKWIHTMIDKHGKKAIVTRYVDDKDQQMVDMECGSVKARRCSMLMSCFFNGVPCKSTNFITFESPSYGGSYAFNAMMKNLPNGGTRDSNEGGGDGILELRLYAHSHQYVPNLSDAVGIMIMVHDNTQLSLIDIADMASGPGRKHKLSFTRKKSYFLSLPYAKCTNQIPLAMQAMFNLFQDAYYAYSQLLCFTNCIQSYT
ncbi:unnamed protein product [Rotaria sp. Silwood1]|nr:unnamed protein product [Rotaria sp. Silwood1]